MCIFNFLQQKIIFLSLIFFSLRRFMIEILLQIDKHKEYSIIKEWDISTLYPINWLLCAI